MSYLINGGSFSTWGLTALSSEGSLNFPKRLGEFEYDWGDSNGVEAYVSSGDLSWDGREIVVKAFYSGSNLYSSIDTMLAALKGIDLTLVTTFASHSCRLNAIKVTKIMKPNRKALLEISFWESSVSSSIPPTAIGGSGVTLGAYDFEADFGLLVKSVSGYGDVQYSSRNLTYGDTPKIMSGYRKNRTITVELNGAYPNITALISNVNALKNLLMSSGSRALVYNGVSKTVYFVDGAKVKADPKKITVNITLNLKVQE